MAGLLDTIAGTQQIPVGLLSPQDTDTAKNMALLALAGGMVRGDFGGGLLGAGQAYQGAQNAAVDRMDKMQQIGLRNIQLQQQMQQFKWLQDAVNGAADGTMSAPNPSAAPIALAQGAQASPSLQTSSGNFNTGGIGPTVANAQRMSAVPGVQIPAPTSNPYVMGARMLGMDPRQFAVMSFTQPKAIETALGSVLTPTEAHKLAVEAGQDPAAAAAATLRKNTYVAPINARPGMIGRDPFTNQPLFYNPHVPDGTMPQFDANGNVVSFQPIGNAEAALALSERAKGFGKAEVTPSVVYGPDGKPQFSTVARDLSRAGMGGIQNANSGLQLTPELQAAIAADAKKNGITNPVVNLSTAEPGMPSASGFNKPMIGLASQSAGVTPQQPAGFVPNADAAQKASAESMKDSYTRLQANGATANAALDALDKMMGLAAKKNPLLTLGPLGTNQSAVNPDAAEYEKQRANVIALLAQQGGTNGTDAGRALTGESVPDFGKPKAAIADGLGTLRNQVMALQLKRDFLTPVYQSGDSKQYTTLENQFDKNISPNMIPLLTMPAGKQRAFALQAAAKDPAMRARLDWAASNGLLK